MSQYPISGGVNYEVPAYVSGSVAPSETMVAPSTDLSHSHDHNGHLDPNMDPSLIPPTQDTAYLQPTQDQEAASFQLQLQAAAANEAAIAGGMQDGSQHIIPQSQPSGLIETTKTKRLGRACDACSKRKVKCGEEIPCKNCVDLQIECTFSRPAKRRGPANKVAQNLKRQRIEDELGLVNETSTSSSALSVESIAPFEKVHTLVYAYFTYLYPIYPFPPETVVLARLSKREDHYTDKSFLALISSMIGLVATTFPRLTEQILSENYSDSSSIVHRCTEICLKVRAPVRESLNVDDAATAFFLAIIARINERPREFSGHASDSLGILQSLRKFQEDGPPTDGIVEDPITKELTSRIFWAIYGTSR
jgi:hypothetical protein